MGTRTEAVEPNEASLDHLAARMHGEAELVLGLTMNALAMRAAWAAPPPRNAGNRPWMICCGGKQSGGIRQEMLQDKVSGKAQEIALAVFRLGQAGSRSIS